MRYIFGFLRFYPFWAIPICLITADLGWRLKRMKDKRYIAYWILSGAFFLSTVLWVYFRGDLYSDLWVKRFFGLR